MRSFIRAFKRLGVFSQRPKDNITRPLNKKLPTPVSPAQSRTIMAGSMTAAAAYALTVTSPSALDPVPEDARDKKHHLKKGFTNPWESYRDFSGPSIMMSIIKYGT